MDRDDGRKAARLAVHAEIADRRWTNTDLARQAGADIATISDFLSGTRWPKSPTQGRIEQAIGWAPGTIAAIAAGMPIPPVGGRIKDVKPDDEFTLRFRRPPGLSDAEWERVKIESEGIVQWTLDRASQER